MLPPASGIARTTHSTHYIKAIASLTDAEVRDLAISAAERGERVEDVNPFAAGTPGHATFTAAFEQCASDLETVA